MAKKDETKWEMLNVAMSYFQEYIQGKPTKYSLSIVDLLHVSNFKGGNASITEPEAQLVQKLDGYAKKLVEIGNLIGSQKLIELSAEKREQLKTLGMSFLDLTQKAKTNIRGFGPSYASALMAAHFPDVLPVLDRRVLNGAEIHVEYQSQGQVKNIITYYTKLIDAFHATLSNEPSLSLRQLDKRWFSKDMPKKKQT